MSRRPRRQGISECDVWSLRSQTDQLGVLRRDRLSADGLEQARALCGAGAVLMPLVGRYFAAHLQQSLASAGCALGPAGARLVTLGERAVVALHALTRTNARCALTGSGRVGLLAQVCSHAWSVSCGGNGRSVRCEAC